MPGHSKVIGKKDDKSIELEGVKLTFTGAEADGTGAISCSAPKKGDKALLASDLGDDFVSGTEYEIACKSNMMMSAVLAIVFAGLGAGAYHMYLQRK